jgi:hypothetical protein
VLLLLKFLLLSLITAAGPACPASGPVSVATASVDVVDEHPVFGRSA